MATISTVKELVLLCRDASTTLFIWGTHGIGKSSAVRQVAQEQGIGFSDMRCAQLEAADLRGFPVRGDDGRTHFLPPHDLPADGCGLLLLDELNRAPEDVLAAAFQLVLDRRIGEYRLPEGWSIVCAGNFDGADYSVTSLDPAFRDRFCHVTLEAGQATWDEWASWMAGRYGDDASTVIDFCSCNLEHLELAGDQSLGFQVLPSRRAWEMAVRCLQAWNGGDYAERTRIEVLAGLVGRDLATCFLKQRGGIRPGQLLERGVARLQKRLDKMTRNQKAALMWGLVSHVRGRLDEIKVIDVLLDYAEYLVAEERDLALAFCIALIQPEKESRPLQTAMLSNPRLATAVARVARQQGDPEQFLERLSQRPDLARSIATAMGVEHLLPAHGKEVAV